MNKKNDVFCFEEYKAISSEIREAIDTLDEFFDLLCSSAKPVRHNSKQDDIETQIKKRLKELRLSTKHIKETQKKTIQKVLNVASSSNYLNISRANFDKKLQEKKNRKKETPIVQEPNEFLKIEVESKKIEPLKNPNIQEQEILESLPALKPLMELLEKLPAVQDIRTPSFDRIEETLKNIRKNVDEKFVQSIVPFQENLLELQSRYAAQSHLLSIHLKDLCPPEVLNKSIQAERMNEELPMGPPLVFPFPKLTDSKYTKYKQRISDTNTEYPGILPQNVAADIMEKEAQGKVSLIDLYRIWEHCNPQKRGFLVLNEWIVLFHLIAEVAEGYPLPDVLPDHIIQRLK